MIILIYSDYKWFITCFIDIEKKKKKFFISLPLFFFFTDLVDFNIQNTILFTPEIVLILDKITCTEIRCYLSTNYLFSFKIFLLILLFLFNPF